MTKLVLPTCTCIQTTLLFAWLYTALNSPSLIFALYRSETDSPSLEFTHSPILVHYPLYIIQLAQFRFALGSEGEKGENKTGAKISLYTVLCMSSYSVIFSKLTNMTYLTGMNLLDGHGISGGIAEVKEKFLTVYLVSLCKGSSIYTENWIDLCHGGQSKVFTMHLVSHCITHLLSWNIDTFVPSLSMQLHSHLMLELL